MLTATDNCDATVAITYNGETRTNGACPDSYTLTRQWTAADNCGNTKTATQRITVQDTQKPAFTNVPANVTVQCSSIPAPAMITATDNCDVTVAITYNGETRANGACPDSYTLTRQWTAADNCGNTKTATQRITVQDTQKPVFTSLPQNLTIQCSQAFPPVGSPVATDNCDASVTITYLGQSNTNATCDNSYQSLRSWVATDNCGNSTVATQTITVQDTQAPVFTSVPANVTIQCSQLIPPIGQATASDACGGYVQIVFQGQTMVPGSCPPNSTITRVWRAQDLCGNSVTASQTITIQDTQAPTFNNAPANVTVACGAALPELPAVFASDNCDTNVPVTYQGQTTTGPNCPYIVTRTWTVSDDCGNMATYTQVISVGAQGIKSAEIQGLQDDDLTLSRENQTPNIAPVSQSQISNFEFQTDPNPAGEEVWVSFELTAENEATVLLFDAEGRLTQRQVFGALAGDNRFRMDLSGLPGGLYTIHVQVAQWKAAKKLFVLKN